jgi:hypothetical protein
MFFSRSVELRDLPCEERGAVSRNDAMNLRYAPYDALATLKENAKIARREMRTRAFRA